MGPQPFHVTPKRRPDRGAGAQGRARPLREDRAPDHEPGGRRRPVRGRPDRGRARRPRRSARVAAQILGQAYVTAHNLAVANRAGIEAIADALEDKREIMGDELLELLERAAHHDPGVRPRRRGRRGRRSSSRPRSAGGRSRSQAPAGLAERRSDVVSETTAPGRRSRAPELHRGRAGPADRAESDAPSPGSRRAPTARAARLPHAIRR